MPSSWQKVVHTPPICITIRLPFVSRYFCRSIRVRGRWNTSNNVITLIFWDRSRGSLRPLSESGKKNSLKINFLGRIFLGNQGPRRRDILDKNIMQVAFSCCFRQGVAGMSRDLGRNVPDLEKFYARELWADFSFPINAAICAHSSSFHRHFCNSENAKPRVRKPRIS